MISPGGKITLTAFDLMKYISNAISSADQEAAAERVSVLRGKYPDASVSELVEVLIRAKCQRAGAIGAATSAAAFIPGVGTLTSLTVGTAADIGMTFKLQAELVLEVAAAHRRLLTESERQQTVLITTGLSAGASQLVRRAGKKASVEICERCAQKWLVKALPVIGVAASAGGNLLATYIIGRRAHAYFSLGPDEVGDWRENWRAITGIDERKIGRWLAEGRVRNSASAAGHTVATGASAAAEALAVTGRSLRHATGAIIAARDGVTSPLVDNVTRLLARRVD
jgi:hypothetical protein